MSQKIKNNEGFSQEFLYQVKNIRIAFNLFIVSLCILKDKNFIKGFPGKYAVLGYDKENQNTMLFLNSFTDNPLGRQLLYPKSCVWYELDNFLEDFINSSQSNLYLDGYVKLNASSFITLMYESFKNDNKRYEEVKKEAWFVMLANLRHNITAHGIDMMWGEIKNYEIEKISYKRMFDEKEITIDTSLNGKGFEFDHIGGLITLLDMGEYIENFVLSKIND